MLKQLILSVSAFPAPSVQQNSTFLSHLLHQETLSHTLNCFIIIHRFDKFVLRTFSCTFDSVHKRRFEQRKQFGVGWEYFDNSYLRLSK